ncbi:MAG TPA: hypothetical protein VFO36_12385, partial [Nitrospiraceae bacterium]|nr:hypothetical protein [Nitrospiraceae bacterium]
MLTSRYFLPRWIPVCFTGDGTIFLDLRHDRYSGLNQQDTATLRQALDDAEDLNAAAHSLASSLVERGLLTNDPTGSRSFSATSFARP